MSVRSEWRGGGAPAVGTKKLMVRLGFHYMHT